MQTVESAKKKIGVTLDPELHSRVKSAAPMRGLNVERAYDQALRAWLGEESKADSDFTAQESLIAAGFIRMVRSREPVAELVLAGVKKWMKDNPVREEATPRASKKMERTA